LGDRPERGLQSASPPEAAAPALVLTNCCSGWAKAAWRRLDAEQTEPVRRTVALKVIKPGMDSSNVLARFEAERQALALMDHQNIARVFDAGTTESGRLFSSWNWSRHSAHEVL